MLLHRHLLLAVETANLMQEGKWHSSKKNLRRGRNRCEKHKVISAMPRLVTKIPGVKGMVVVVVPAATRRFRSRAELVQPRGRIVPVLAEMQPSRGQSQARLALCEDA